MEAQINKIYLISPDFKTDLKHIDVSLLLQRKKWEKLGVLYPEFHNIETEIQVWLKENMPSTFNLITLHSNRKAYDKDLINFIKTKVAIDQGELMGLKSLDHGHLFNLYHSVIETIFKIIKKKYKTHDVNPDIIEKSLYASLENIDPQKLYPECHFSEKYVVNIDNLISKQQDSLYLNTVKQLLTEAELLSKLYKSVDCVKSSPKYGSDYHGYTLSKYSYNPILSQTCSGSKYPPFEVSPEGTLQALKENKELMEKSIKKLEALNVSSSNLAYEKEVSRLKHIISSGKYFQSLALEKLKKSYPNEHPDYYEFGPQK